MPSTVSNTKKFGFFTGGYQSKFQNFVEKILNIKIEQEETDDMIILNIKRENPVNEDKEKALLREKIINIKKEEEDKILKIKEEQEDAFSFSYEKCDTDFSVSEEPPKPSLEAVNCTECSKEVTKYNFVEHLTSCVSKPFHCHVQGCQISFVTEDDLNQHAREVHWSPSKHRHESTLVNLSEIATIKYEDCEFRCDVEGCKYSHQSKSHLRTHVMRVHNSPMVKCPHSDCDSLLKHYSLYHHLKSVHNSKRLCRNCDKIIDCRDFERHSKTCEDSLRCTFEGCRATFSSKKGQRLHVTKLHLYNNKTISGPKPKITKQSENVKLKTSGKTKSKKNCNNLLQSLGLRLPMNVPIKSELKCESTSELLARLNSGCKRNGLSKKVQTIKQEKDLDKRSKIPQKKGPKKNVFSGELKKQISKNLKSNGSATQVKKSIINGLKESTNGLTENIIVVKKPKSNGARESNTEIKKQMSNGFTDGTIVVKKPKSNASKNGTAEIVVENAISNGPQEHIDRKFKCGHEGCHAAFTSLANLKSHIKGVHQAPITCPREGCGRVMKANCLKIHFREYHDKIKKECVFCGNQYAASYLVLHEKKCAEKSASDAFL